MLYTGCPLVSACIGRLLADYNEEDPLTMERATCEELKTDANALVTTDEDIRLRMFYVVEFFYHEIVPRALFREHGPARGALSQGVTTKEYLKDSYPRSVDGLTQLCTDVERLRARLIALSVHYRIRRSEDGIRQQLLDTYTRLNAIVQILQGCVETLQACLRQSSVEGARAVGAALGEGIRCVHLFNYEVEAELRTLLSVNKERAIAPWQKNFR